MAPISNAARKKAEREIPAEIRMISGSEDAQTSADVKDVGKKFKLPDSEGRPGGACTSALLTVLKKHGSKEVSFQKVMLDVREQLKKKGFKQIPQLSSSRPLDVGHTKFDLVPDHYRGRKRAVMIGINYEGHSPGELSGCHNDVASMKNYIMKHHGFKKSDMTILMDDGKHEKPTKARILRAYKEVVEKSRPGDSVFCHYSGHGGRVKDKNGDEEDGMDETLIPLDYKKNGQIIDDVLYKILCKGFRKGVYCTFLMDCCHSGSVLDLPFVFTADGKHENMEVSTEFHFNDLVALGTDNVNKIQHSLNPPGEPTCCSIL